MKLQFLKGMDGIERVRIYEQVISGDLLLHTIIPNGFIVVLESKFKSAEKEASLNGDIISFDDVEPTETDNRGFARYVQHDHYWLLQATFIFMDAITSNDTICIVQNGEQVALRLLGDLPQAPVKVLYFLST